MTDFEVRAVSEDERRTTLDLLLRALHGKPTSDEGWARGGVSWPAADKFAAFAGGVPIGIVSSYDTEMAVPGGAHVPAAAVDGVAVRADRTRRGVLSAMMREQLAHLAGRGFPLACLHASEPTIYGRFGYGSAALGKTVSISRPAARLRDGIGAGGRVRLLTADEAVKEIPALYQRIGLTRPGMITRPDLWWPIAHDRYVRPDGDHLVAVHSGPEGDDGFVVYETLDRRTIEQPELGTLVNVRELHAANDAARAGLWRFLLSVDLVSGVHARYRPVDDPIAMMLTDQRHARTTEIEDDLWLRLLDVGAALAARTYRDGPPVVLAVKDPRLPANTGHYEVGFGGAHRTEAPAELTLDVDTLAMLYLGHWSATQLVQTGRIEAVDPSAVSRADELFTTVAAPWCGTYF